MNAALPDIEEVLTTLQRTANGTKSRKPRVETVLSYAVGMASHELAHLDQLARTIEHVHVRARR